MSMLARAAVAAAARMDRSAVALSAPVISGALLPGGSIACTPGTWTRSPGLTYTLIVNGNEIALQKVSLGALLAYVVLPGVVSAQVYEHASVGGGVQPSNTIAFYPEALAGSYVALEIGRSPQTLSGSDFTGVIGDLSPEGNDFVVSGTPGYEAAGLNGQQCIRFDGFPDRAAVAAVDNGTGGTLTEYTSAHVFQDIATANGLFYMHSAGMAFSQRTTAMRSTFPTGGNIDAAYTPPALKFGVNRWDGALGETFLDGVLINSGAAVATGPADGIQIAWGSTTSPSSYANFRSSGLWIFSRALTDDELTHLIAYMRFTGKIP